MPVVVLLLICILITLLGAWPIVGYLALGASILWAIWWAFEGLCRLFPGSIEPSGLPIDEYQKKIQKRTVRGLLVIGVLTILHLYFTV